MGGGIAAVVANAGIAVYLLDIAANDLTPVDEQLGLTIEDPQVRNRIVSAMFDRLKKWQPPAFFTPETAELVTIGNLEDNFGWVAEADWIVEAVVEQTRTKTRVNGPHRKSEKARQHCLEQHLRAAHRLNRRRTI